jgi:outer membrane biosynthesis protein TonB
LQGLQLLALIEKPRVPTILMRKIVFFFVLLFSILLVACAPEEQVMPPVPTNTPVPTFTPTPEIVVTPVNPAVATTPAVAAEATASQDVATAVVEQPSTGEATQTPEPDQPTPTETAAPANPVVTTNQGMNVRGGPGTNYNIIGAATAGQQFVVTGKNPQGDWWQIDFNGQTGWLYGPLVTPQNTGSVQVAANIPAPPPTATPAPATATPVPQPTQPPAPQAPTPTPQPVSNYKFNIAVVGRCDPNGGVTYVQGKTYVGGVPQSGDWLVAFSYAPDGPIVARIKAGPHPGYEGWDQGFYSHILQHDGPREGNWWFWVVDPGGNRISEMANVHTDGEAGPGKCQQAIVDFDSR